MISDVVEDMLPLYAQKEAQRMVCENRYSKILFTLIVPNRVPIECVWIDPHYGMFTIKCREKTGFLMLKQLEPGSFIINQRYDE
jgi:hypothetical protein